MVSLAQSSQLWPRMVLVHEDDDITLLFGWQQPAVMELGVIVIADDGDVPSGANTGMSDTDDEASFATTVKDASMSDIEGDIPQASQVPDDAETIPGILLDAQMQHGGCAGLPTQILPHDHDEWGWCGWYGGLTPALDTYYVDSQLTINQEDGIPSATPKAQGEGMPLAASPMTIIRAGLGGMYKDVEEEGMEATSEDVKLDPGFIASVAAVLQDIRGDTWLPC